MLVRTYYHYPCQGVISFVLSLPDGVGNSQATRPKVTPAKSGDGAKSIFFSRLEKAWIPAFAGMTVVVRGYSFCCGV
jgi:hypothetical protein